MGKKTVGRHPAKPAFRESDFAGMPAQDQANLSGSLNQLSQQLAATRLVLRDIEAAAPAVSAPAVFSPAESAAQGPSSDDAAPRG